MQYYRFSYLISFLFGISLSIANISGSDGFQLITCLYNEKHKNRINEYIQCLDRNLAHPLIEQVHVIYDTSNDDDKNELLNTLKSRKIVIYHQNRRQTFGDCYNLANQMPQKSRVIICNADIYFNETLFLLGQIDLSHLFLALTRWDVKKDGSLEPGFDEIKSTRSQDAWILQTPIKKFKDDNIHLGAMGCEGAIAYEAKQSDLLLFNPCLSIQACHLHLTDLRTYDLRARPYRNYPWEQISRCSIETIKTLHKNVIQN